LWVTYIRTATKAGMTMAQSAGESGMQTKQGREAKKVVLRDLVPVQPNCKHRWLEGKFLQDTWRVED
jgi:hypothetical protein